MKNPVSDLRNPQPLRLRQPSLPLIESPKAFGFEFEGAGDVQAIKRPDAEFRAVAASEVRTNLKRVLRHRN